LSDALHELGVGPGQVVAIQLPNWWQTSAVVLACARLGAADIATRLPQLRHRVVLGEHVRTGEVDFALHFEHMPWEKRHGISLDDPGEDPDQVSVATFTSGSTGAPKAVLHTFNTFYAGYSPIAAEDGLGPDDRLFTPHPLTHGWGMRARILLRLLVGARSVVLDIWEPMAALARSTGATVVLAAPVFLSGLVAEARKQSEKLPALRRIVTGVTTIPDGLIADLADWSGVSPQWTRGMSRAIGG
jgi:cyclohexanecarboxylate-CoA ligase